MTITPAIESSTGQQPSLNSGNRITAETFTPLCPSRVLLEHVTSKWGVLILLALADSGMRWGELRRSVGGISEKMLASTLRTLENDHLVDRTVAATVPPRVDYALTETGRELATLLTPLAHWVRAHSSRLEEDRNANPGQG
ncbi:winged helix-turn-helix transcriptional regulator [Streptomyces chartreusis]|uniref:Helix-turn-helix transcriptional regulator n=1 Tax=Streptomyces chartreusis TaxID=1969 RepID=A0A7H8T1Q8_STRCX|nr:helix-turn-helix domain-containing protein [Streptomyces chartreusis]QKZ17314.1 helix-turn-helix transcriptional regulator [Streptomyces chartreusis]